jgi:hypothetical protein
MKSLKILATLLLWLLTASFLAPENALGKSDTYMLGSTAVVLNSYAVGSGRVYFAPHSNETTAVSAAKSIVKKNGGKVLWLSHGDGQRNITFTLKGKSYAVDPNRIFSDAGAKASLKPYSPEALKEVRKFAKWLIGRIFSSGVRPLVGIHNNTEGSLSVTSYASGANRREAKQTFAAPGRDADDFFFVTRADYFVSLKKKSFNVVLQAWPIADDGSLSVYCQRNGVPYINVEAQNGHLSQQVDMIKALSAL